MKYIGLVLMVCLMIVPINVHASNIELMKNECKIRVENSGGKGFNEVGIGVAYIIEYFRDCPINNITKTVGKRTYIFYFRIPRSEDKYAPIDLGFTHPEYKLVLPLDIREIQTNDSGIQIKMICSSDDVFVKELRNNDLLLEIGGSNKLFKVKAYKEQLLELENILNKNIK